MTQKPLTLADFKRIRKMLEEASVPTAIGPGGKRYYWIAIDPKNVTPKFRAQCKKNGLHLVETMEEAQQYVLTNTR